MSRRTVLLVSAAVVALVCLAAVVGLSSRPDVVPGRASPLPAPSASAPAPVVDDAYPRLSEPLDGAAAVALLPVTLTRSGGLRGGETVVTVDRYGHVVRTDRDEVVREWNLQREELEDLVSRLEAADLPALAAAQAPLGYSPDAYVFELVTPSATVSFSLGAPEPLAPAMELLGGYLNRD